MVASFILEFIESFHFASFLFLFYYKICHSALVQNCLTLLLACKRNFFASVLLSFAWNWKWVAHTSQSKSRFQKKSIKWLRKKKIKDNNFEKITCTYIHVSRLFPQQSRLFLKLVLFSPSE